MPSNAYSAHLNPDPWLRIIVLSSGRLLLAIGLGVILSLELPVAARVVGSLLWLALGKVELVRLQRGFDACAAMRVHADGRIEVLDGTDQWRPCELLSGSMVLRNLAWIRLQSSSGSVLAELYCGNVRDSQDWRRLQVIWRRIGA